MIFKYTREGTGLQRLYDFCELSVLSLSLFIKVELLLQEPFLRCIDVVQLISVDEFGSCCGGL